MKRTTLFIALASAASLSVPAYAESSWSKATQRVESMNGQQGESPDLVKQAQEKLSSLGKDVGTPDGQMGAKTQQALKEYQQEKGLQPTGQLDQQTIAALNLSSSGSAATGGSAPKARPSDSD